MKGPNPQNKAEIPTKTSVIWVPGIYVHIYSFFCSFHTSFLFISQFTCHEMRIFVVSSPAVSKTPPTPATGTRPDSGAVLSAHKKKIRGLRICWKLDAWNILKTTPRKINGWNLRMHPWKRKIIFQTIIFRFYVNLPGVYMTSENPPCSTGKYIDSNGALRFASWVVGKSVNFLSPNCRCVMVIYVRMRKKNKQIRLWEIFGLG